MPLNYSGTLVAPISINARYVDASMSVNDAMAEFSRLPWSNTSEVYNSSTPFLGEAVMSPPFQDQNFVLGSGVHLHWVLPRSHRTYQAGPINGSGRVLPPAAPNCWLVTRKSDGTQWVVESDFISYTQSKKQGNENAVSVPSAKIGLAEEQPFVYLGRQLKLADWLAAPISTEQKWSSMGKGSLSAFGYGELAFNSYYPNCHSVFGFYDEAPTDPASDTYEVLGWYRSSDDDIVQTTFNRLQHLLNNHTSDPDLLEKLFEPQNGECPAWCKTIINGASLKPAQWHSAWNRESNAWAQLQASSTDLLAYFMYGLAQELQWEFGTDMPASCPQSSVYYAQVVMGQNINVPSFNQVAVGHTGLEALCAYLAPQVLNSMPAAGGGQPALTQAGIEADLNALMHGAAVKRDLIDIDENIKETQHNEQFDPHQGETIWRIRREKKVESHTIPGPPAKEASDLPDDLAGLLNDLNLAEVAYQEAEEKLNQAHFQIYSDWCKYMQCSYPPLGTSDNLPDTDLIKNYVEWQCSEVLFGKLEKELENTLVKREAAKTALDNTLNSVNQNLQHHEYVALDVPGPRYYAPKDPVVLFAAEVTQPVTGGQSKQLKSTGFLESLQAPVGSARTAAVVNSMQDSINTLVNNSTLKTEGETWSPQLLQWLVDYKPDTSGSSISSSNGDFSPDFMSHYALANNAFGLEKSSVSTSAQGIEFAGTTYASTGTKAHMIKILQDVVDQATDTSSVPVEAAKQALGILGKSDLTVITQVLGGFHKGLLQQKHNIQLPIADPIGFEAYQPFTQEVNSIVSDAYVAAPLPDNYFFPIRAGLLSLEKLALIDEFGVSNGVDTQSALIAHSLHSGLMANARLMPAFSQETRLNFRWLAAQNLSTDTDVETNSHPATTPICGWLMPNILENSLMVYDTDGNGLGSMIFDETTKNYKNWQEFPASITSLSNFPTNQGSLNAHFYEVLQSIKADTSGFLKNVELAQGQINPEYFSGHNSLAMLVGKPVAVVRAQIGLNSKSGTLYDQGWIPFENQLQGEAPVTTEYDKVTVNIRLGDNGQLNDGLIAFAEKASATSLQPFNWVDSNDGTDSKNYVTTSLDAGMTNLTLLMEPHGIVHATSGILPVKTINIPPEQYTSALKKMQVDFRIQPVLTPATRLQLSLPKENGYKWSWLQQVGDDWLEVPDMMLISETLFTNGWNLHLKATAATTPSATTLWPMFSTAGCTKALPYNSELFQLFSLTDDIKSALAAKLLASLDPKPTAATAVDLVLEIESVLNGSATGMAAFKEQLEFYPKQELIEGWLRLSEVDS